MTQFARVLGGRWREGGLFTMTVRLLCTLNLLILGFRAFWLGSHCSNLLYPWEKCLAMLAVHFGKNFQNILRERTCSLRTSPTHPHSKCTLVSWELQNHSASSLLPDRTHFQRLIWPSEVCSGFQCEVLELTFPTKYRTYKVQVPF